MNGVASEDQSPGPERLPWRPTWAFPPGETLLEWMTETHVSESELGERTGIPDGVVSGILHGTASITEEIAERLAVCTQVSAQFWLNLQAHYDRFKTTMPLAALDDALERAGVVLKDLGSDTSTGDRRARIVENQLLAVIADVIEGITTDITAVSELDSALTPDRIVFALRSRVRALTRLVERSEDPDTAG